MTIGAMTLEQVEELRDAILENKSDFGVKTCELIERPKYRGEWGLRLTYEFDDKGNRAESSIDVFTDYKAAVVMRELYTAAAGKVLDARANGAGG